jgi:hypothetical protein
VVLDDVEAAAAENVIDDNADAVGKAFTVTS